MPKNLGPLTEGTISESVVLALICSAFLVSCVYYGSGTNLSMLFYAALLLLMALALNSAQRLSNLFQDHPGTVCVVGGTLLALTVHHLALSWSRDSSFAASVTLAAVPIVVVLSLLAHPKKVFRTLFWPVCGFSIFAVVDFLFSGTRAYLPLADPNNFVTMLFLIWLPWLNERLLRGGDGRKWVSLSALASFVFSLAVLATGSRFAVAVLVVALLYWVLGVLLRKVKVRDYFFVTVGMLVGAVMYMLRSGFESVVVNAGAVAAVAAEETYSTRLMLLKSAWEIIWSGAGVAGSGIYTFSLLYPSFRSPLDQHTTGLFVHNDYLQIFQEGGILLFLPLLILVGWVGWCWLKSLGVNKFWSVQNGFLFAVSMALCHAAVNFTFYILPLGFVFGVVLANALSDPQCDKAAKNVNVAKTKTQSGWRWFRIAYLGLGVWVVALLGLEAMNYAVFSGQKGLPFALDFSRDGQAQKRYAQTSIALNPDRGLPRFALAKIEELMLADRSEPEKVRAVEQLYINALQADPWNPTLLLSYSKFLSAQGMLAQAHDLSMQAIALNPMDADLVLAGMELKSTMADDRGVHQLAIEVMAWCELIARRDPESLDRLGQAIKTLSTNTGSVELEAGLDACRRHRVESKATQRESVWLMRLFTGGDSRSAG